MSQNLVMQPSKGQCNQVVKIVVPYCIGYGTKEAQCVFCESQFRRLEKSLPLCLLCAYRPTLFCVFELALSPSYPLLSNIDKECTCNANLRKTKNGGTVSTKAKKDCFFTFLFYGVLYSSVVMEKRPNASFYYS